MTDTEVRVEVQLRDTSPGQPELMNLLEEDISDEDCDCEESLQLCAQRETEEKLLLLADVALAPLCGERLPCSCRQVTRKDPSLQSTQLQHQFFMSKADHLHNCLVNGQDHPDRGALAAAVPNFLYTCVPYFNHLESTARSLHTLLPVNMSTRLLDFSQQLCDRLEQLVLTYASHSLLCLDEAEPNSVSHFCIGQCQLGQLRMTIFRYCKPAPYMNRVDTGLFKRMRWNVERLRDEEQAGESEERDAEMETVGDADYYFLCYEDMQTDAEADGDSQGESHGGVVRMWSIGQWVQVNPDPVTEDISDWILCEVPQGSFHQLLFLGSDEPSSCSATDYLQQLLSPCPTTD